MARANPIINSFSGGELSPLLASRPELEKYQAGLLLCENAIPRVQGALERRGGTRFVQATKDSSDRSWLVEFIYSETDAFVLEFGDLYIRFYRNRGVLTDGGLPYEIVSPWPASALVDEDGSFALNIEQSGDVLYLAHAGGAYAPHTLTRLSNTDWVLASFFPTGGPFKDQNTDEAITVYATGTVTVGSSVTLTASSAIFQAGHVGGLFYLEMKDGRSLKPWQNRNEVALAEVRRSDGKYYAVSAVPASGTDPIVTGDDRPVHTSGRYWDGDGVDRGIADDGQGPVGVEWEYLHAGYGWVQISGYTSATEVTATVVSRLPAEVVGSGNASWRWALGAWSTAEGWPDNVGFFRERLVWFKGATFYGSVAGDFTDYKAKEHGFSDISSAIIGTIQSPRGDAVKWIAAGKKLIVGTGGGEVAISEQTSNQVFGPGNAKADPESSWGSRGVAPAKVGAAVLYVEKGGRALREMRYSLDSDSLESADATNYAEHLMHAGLIDLAYQKTPHSVLWAVRADGMLLGLTYSLSEGVMGWHRHPIGSPDLDRDADGEAIGFGEVESVAVIPSPDGGRDDVWLIVKRTINGSVVRYVEYIAAEYRKGDDAALSAYQDSHLIYNGAAATVISGLSHLEGCTVQIKADGYGHPDRVVTAGAVTLIRAASKVVVGLKAPHRGRIMPLEAGAQLGTAQGKPKRVARLKVRLLNTLGGVFGSTFDAMDPLEYRTAAMPMDSAPPLFSGIKDLRLPDPIDVADAVEAGLCWEFSGPFPVTVVALMPELNTNEG